MAVIVMTERSHLQWNVMLNHLRRHETKNVFFLICGVRRFLDNSRSKMEEDSLLNRTLHQRNVKPKFVFVTH